ncbi:hypothetical protein NOL00_12090 [Vibrio parahaemolyticus]|uniref:hypothetical protein n=1 Tax=Vibrio harveyi group TaxID=717610 RepID=UPI00226AF0B2|nr:hypothetical protein [Vibrio parahaemolyticus]MCX8811806.1 hypothetical protein [Vibrio parahaemolyticus]MCX8837749.1 hypothetical protein [Vibrio parahaemolyticus]MCX8906435.1 hypothetical protein [Vibrio parahaemolyticus]HAV1571896.1 hypothetical protein [Vibrio parahaemolyticus]HAV1575176.1 hypothetical protein [Vibrio parahaemolyticus]
MHYTPEAAMVYCTQNRRLQPVLAIIQALIEGKTAEQIIREQIAPSLSIRTIQYYASKYQPTQESH